MSMPPVYSTKMNEPIQTGSYYQRTPHPNSLIYQAQPFPVDHAGDYPVTCTCPYCRQVVVTRTKKKSGVLVWLIASGMVLFGCICGCCLIPFCVKDLKDTTHYCPNCNRIIAKDKML